MADPPSAACPCGSGTPVAACCDRYLSGAVPAPTAEALMRSRYVAYVLRREDYLLATWHPTTRPAALGLHDAPAPKWIGLEVKRDRVIDADTAIVEFVARYKVGARAHRMHEVSRFVRVDGRWYYVSAEDGRTRP